MEGPYWWPPLVSGVSPPALCAGIGIERIEEAVIALEVNRRAEWIVRVEGRAGANLAVSGAGHREGPNVGAVGRVQAIENARVGTDIKLCPGCIQGGNSKHIVIWSVSGRDELPFGLRAGEIQRRHVGPRRGRAQ